MIIDIPSNALLDCHFFDKFQLQPVMIETSIFLILILKKDIYSGRLY